MRLSTKSYYGLRGIAYLAKEGKSCSVRKISEEEHLPQKYLEKILQKLRGAGLLSSQKGAAGGYYLSRKPEKYNLFEVIGALEGETIMAPCLGKNINFCRLKNFCQEKGSWEKLGKALDRALGKITLDQLE